MRIQDGQACKVICLDDSRVAAVDQQVDGRF